MSKECGLKNGDVITAIDGVNVKWKTSTEVLDILNKHLLSNHKKEEHTFERIIDNYDRSQPTVTIKVITLISSEIPKVQFFSCYFQLYSNLLRCDRSLDKAPVYQTFAKAGAE